MTQPRQAGFTIFELLLVVLMIGLLGSLLVGGFNNVVPAGRETAAVMKARILNAARTSYALTAADASTQWSASGSETDRAVLLVNAGLLQGTGGEWLSASGGYTLSLSGALKDKTILRDKAGVQLHYTD